MNKIRYCTPEWLSESDRLYQENPELQHAMRRVTAKVFFQITSYPEWGITDDIIFGAVVEEGKLLELAFFSKEASYERAEFILSTSPLGWKSLLRKESKFIADFLTGKVVLLHGSRVGVLSIAPYASFFVDALTQFDLQFQDEMTSEELDEFGNYFTKFRMELKV